MASATPEVCKDYLDADPNVTQHIVRYEKICALCRSASTFDRHTGVATMFRQQSCVVRGRVPQAWSVQHYLQKRLGEITTAPLSHVNLCHVRLLRLFRHPLA